MDSRLVSFLVFCSLLAQPVGALGEHQLINPRKPGGPARDPNALETPGLPLAPAAPAYSQPIDPRRSGGPQRDRDTLGVRPPVAATRDGGTLGAPPPVATTRPTPPPAPSIPASQSAAPYRLTGIITSVTDTRVVLSSTTKGKKTTTTFVLNPDTVKQGTLRPGAKVTVSYRVERNDKVARRVEAQGKRPHRSPERRR